MALLLHYTGQDYTSRGLLNTQLTPGSTSAIVGGCKTGRGFQFDNTVNSSLSGSLALNHVEFSLSCWFMITATPPTGGRNVIFTTNPGTSNRIILDVDDNNVIRFIVHLDQGASFKAVLGSVATLNKWYHVVATCNDSNKIIRIFVNGILVSQDSYAGVLNIANYFSVGNRIGLTQYFNGQICNFKYYNHVLSSREIAEDYKSLMLHYKLDKPITDTVYDASGFNRHIAVVGNTTTNSTTEKRVYGGSLANDGTKTLYGTLNLSELDGINEISIALRFRILTNTPHCLFACRRGYSGAGIAFFKESPNKTFSFDMGVRSTVNMTDTFVYGNWYDFVGVKDATTMKSYINGKLVTTLNTTAPVSLMGSSYASIAISNSDSISSINNPLTGNVQDIRLYAKALTQAEVTELYQTRHMVDKDSNCYTYELIEGQTTVGMNKKGQLLCDEIIENEDGTFQIANNKTIKTKEIKEI